MQRAALGVLAAMIASRPSAAQTAGGKFWTSVALGYGLTKTNGTQSVIVSGFGVGYGPYGTVGLSVHVGETVNRWVRVGGGLRYSWQLTTDWAGEPVPVLRHVKALASVHLPRLGGRGPSPVVFAVAAGAAHYSEAFYGGGCASGPNGAYCWRTLQTTATGDGWSADVSLRYEASLGRGLSMTPVLSYEFCHVSGVSAPEPGWPVTDFGESVVELGIGLAYH